MSPHPHSTAWRTLASAFAATLALLVVFAAAASLAHVRLHEGRIVHGVIVAGVDVGGLDRGAAEARLREQLAPMGAGTLTLTVGGQDGDIRYAEIGRDYDMTTMLDAAMAAGRDAERPLARALDHLRVLRDGVAVEPRIMLDAGALHARVVGVAESASFDPVDATLVRRGGQYEVVPSSDGLAVDGALSAEMALSALHRVAAVDVRIELPSVPVEPAVDTAQAAEAVDRFESVVGRPLTVEAGATATQVATSLLRTWVALVPSEDGWSLVFDNSAVTRFAQRFADEANADVQEARLVFEGDELAVVPGVVGIRVDVGATAEVVLGALQDRAEPVGAGYATAADAPSAGVVLEAAADIVNPDLTTAHAEDLAERMEQLSRWRTRYTRGILNYDGANIDIPTEVIHETVLMPGERFDFWEVVGFPAREDGYGPGGAIINGEMTFDETLAGGICAVSTTVFNAALRAGLETGARRAHHFHLERYPLGLDATVWLNRNGRGTTVRFTNDMAEPVIIRGIGRRNAVIFEVWGVPDGREVNISRPRIQDRGATYDVWRTRTVTAASGEVIHDDTYHSRYAWPTAD